MIDYQFEPNLSVDEFIDCLIRSTLGERRPINQRETMQRMIDNSSILVTARTNGLLIGVSRALSDFAYCTYLSDLAVDAAFQKQGIGKRLIELTHEKAGKHTSLILLAAPKAQTYYPHIGFEQHPSCWWRRHRALGAPEPTC